MDIFLQNKVKTAENPKIGLLDIDLLKYHKTGAVAF